MPLSENPQELKREIFKRDHKIKELESLTTKDSLTGLYNRRGFTELTHLFFKDTQKAKLMVSQRKHFIIDSISVIFFDIDNFKKINDTYGHEMGDKILQLTAGLIKEKLRSSDIPGRWGGEEMVAALLGANERDAALKAEEIRKAIKSRVQIPNAPDHQVTISIGVAEIEKEGSFEQLVERADKAMYKAKHSGKDKVVKWSEV